MKKVHISKIYVMPHHHTIQTHTMQLERFYKQIQARKVDSGQYFGSEHTARKWSELITAINLTRHFPEITFKKDHIVDIGPGDGIACRQLLRIAQGNFSNLTLIDVSEAML